MSKNLFKYLKNILPIIGIIIFLIILYSLDLNKVYNLIKSINPIYIILVILPSIPRVMIRNYGWRYVQKEQGIEIGYFQSLKILLIGYFYGCITPGYYGRLIRISYLKKKTGEPYGKLFINTMITTVLHNISHSTMIVLGAIAVVNILPELFYFSIIWISTTIIVALYFINKNRGEKTLLILIKFFIPRFLKKDLNNFVKTFYKDFPEIKRLIYPFCILSTTWIILFSQFYILSVAVGADIPYLYFILLFPIANAISFIPITFAGLGTREATAIFIFSTLFDVSEEKMFIIALLGYLLIDLLTGFTGFLLSMSETDLKKEEIRIPGK